MSSESNKYRWGIIAVVIYSGLSLIGAGVNFLGQLAIDADGFDIVANILTSTQGFFTGVMGYGDFFEYSGFHIVPFIWGGICWFLFAMFLSSISKRKETLHEKFGYIGKVLMITGIIAFIISAASTIAYMLISQDGFAVLLVIFLAVIYVPLFAGGVVFVVLGKYYARRSIK